MPSGGSTRRRSRSAWAEVARLERELADARAEAESAERDRDWLAHAAAEIDALAPQPGEETALAEERAAMQAGAKAGEALAGIDELLGGSDGALAQLRLAARRIERGALDHPLLGEALAALDRAVIEAAEAEDRIAKASDAMAFDPARLESVEARLFDIRAARPQASLSRPMRWRRLGEEMQAQARGDRASGERVAELEAALAEARETFDRTRRRAAARRADAAADALDAKVAAELAPLKLDAARFRTAFGRAEPGPSGIDRVEYRSVDQSRRAVRAADPDRQRRRIVALHPRAEGRAGRGGRSARR